jgi:hypothetical protein
MGVLYPILGAGQIYGNVALRGQNTFLDFDDADHPGGIEIQFYSITGELIGIIGSKYEKSNLKKVEIKINKIGDLIGYNFIVGRRLDIPFFNDVETRFFINGLHWFTGLLVYEPDQGRRNVQYNYQGKGFWNYTERITINKLYQNKTLAFILDDIIDNELVPKSGIVYDENLINPPNLTVTKLELNDKTIEDAFMTILKYANNDYINAQYRMGVNKEKKIFFDLIDTEISYGFFEGYQFQNPDIEIDTDELINKINIYRSKEDSDEVEFLTSINDSDSIDEWGERLDKLIIPDYVDSADGQKIAQAKLQLRKDPRIKIDIKELTVEDEPYEFTNYNINTRRTEYIINVSDFEALAAWNIQTSITAVTRSQAQVFTKRASFKSVQANGSVAEYMEFTLEEAVYFVSTLLIYANQNVAGNFFFITIFDDWGNSEVLGEDIFLTTENDILLTTEDGVVLELEQSKNRIDILADFVKIELPVIEIDNIKKIRITFLANENVIIYFDRLDLEANIWKKETLIPDEFLYNFEKANFKMNAIFGEKTANIVDDIKKIDKKTLEILSIFEKQ